MLFPLKAICDPKKVRRDGTSLIYIQYCYSSENRTLLNTEIAIPHRYWNKRKLSITPDLPQIYGSAKHLNAELTRMHRVAEDIIASAEKSGTENIGAFVKVTFTPKLMEDTTGPAAYSGICKKADLFEHIDDYIQSKTRKVTPKAIAAFTSMKMHLLAYQEHTKTQLSFSSFDFSFYEAFVDYLAYDYKLPRTKQAQYGLMTNSIGKTIKQLRIFVADS
ncbi:MAG: phage integrase SAM-like domain-containing protein [Taibaiella sp.]|nr:phage integrase SAM-like domain-containing protein [Taibaiella sp.]